MSWHIEVIYGPGMKPTLWSYGYPTKQAADNARSRLIKDAKGSARRYKVKRSPS
jgi:hypothetical protein